MELKIGDIVTLKSDLTLDVLMTINGTDGPNLFFCTWFAGNEVKQYLFHKDALKKYQ